MKVVIQRVSQASVTIDGNIKSSIGNGLLILVGIMDEDDNEDAVWLCNKITNLRIFDDAANIPNLSVKEIDGEMLVISQFTLFASTKKGNRPSYINASKPEIATPIYENFLQQLETSFGKKIYTGTFGADMKVSLINDGPITIIIDSKNRE